MAGPGGLLSPSSEVSEAPQHPPLPMLPDLETSARASELCQLRKTQGLALRSLGSKCTSLLNAYTEAAC